MSQNTDWGDLYLEHVDAVAGLLPTLSDEELATTVPGCPEWTVHDLLRHLAGVAAANATGDTEGAPGPDWTKAHVAARRDVGVDDLVTELRSHAGVVAAAAREARTPASVWDIAVHHADLHEALDRGRPPERFWQPVVDRLRSRVPAPLADVDDYELFRALFSRRSRGQMQGWAADADPTGLDEMCIFGPRDDDQPVPTT